ncbi:hypothetical protein BOTBODRAFT_175709 [Botryobasidium botryosum FD-172 SS1]|uniref:Large ribosomal subunit protein mL59 domain-containing protein n=1 Tax=Botryobasidium botryosum (strain FD-172 SS1) TaxID=930990 RepID=A0A067MPA5_BOTB1|nr:hypothetical protein BOTBODRAFT_175709 [Botryobasidium botryosum FD-172 SS1]
MTSKLLPRASIVHNFFTREIEHAAKTLGTTSTSTPTTSTTSASSATPHRVLNPFIPRRNEASGRWAPPRYSLRRQADLFKRARELGVEGLLPAGPKTHSVNPEPSRATAALGGAPVPAILWEGAPKEKISKGLYGGRRTMFKGHKWERELAERERGKKERREERLKKKMERAGATPV